jgi:SNF2 family DNA or RNA helicase
VKYIMATSGTPIKNNASEYFPILNLLKPELFYEQTAFIQNWTDSYRSAYGWKVGGLRNPPKFKEFTKDFIIRRTRKEVLPDLPLIRRNYSYTDMNEEVAKKYKAVLKEFNHYMDNTEDNEMTMSSNILGYMNRMRHLTGYAKIADVISYVDEFIENEEGEKLTIFHHHIDVADILEHQLVEDLKVKVFRMKSTMDASERNSTIEAFKAYSGTAVMLAPTLACGEGINLQFCSHAIVMEREWNPANEEQAEGRFSRIGSTADSIEIRYPVAIGSIDELFAEYVEKKRQWVRETMSGNSSASNEVWQQSKVIKDIGEKLQNQAKASWKKENLGK